jgi:hypothetical protein
MKVVIVLSSHEPVPQMTHPCTNRRPVTAWYHRVNTICPSSHTHRQTDLQPAICNQKLKYPHKTSQMRRTAQFISGCGHFYFWEQQQKKKKKAK